MTTGDPHVVGEAGPSRARRPEDLGRLFVERARAGDVEGVVALYEPSAVLSLPGGGVAAGVEQIRTAYQHLLAVRRAFPVESENPPLVNGDLALTSTRTPRGATAEVARRQPDGTWLWIIDLPDVLSQGAP